MDLVVGKRYRFTYRNEKQRLDHECVMDYLGEEPGRNALSLNARPIAGTQTLPKHWIKSVTEVSGNTPILIDRRVRP